MASVFTLREVIAKVRLVFCFLQLQVLTLSFFKNHFNDYVDVDECSTANGGCEQFCSNNIGSFSCLCYPGYELSGDALACEGRWIEAMFLLHRLLCCRCGRVPGFEWRLQPQLHKHAGLFCLHLSSWLLHELHRHEDTFTYVEMYSETRTFLQCFLYIEFQCPEGYVIGTDGGSCDGK